MKNMKKIVSLMLALVMVLALSMNVLADDVNKGTSDTVKGKITIDNATVGETYSIYKLFDLESWDESKNAYAYTITKESPWYGFVSTGAGKDYVTLDETTYKNIYVAGWVKDADVVAFAKAAKEYATTNSIATTATSETATTTTVEFTELLLGYYLVDTTLGTLCSLDTTNSEVTIQEKNEVPAIDKTVKEDSKTEGATDEYGKSNTAQVGDTVEFKSVVTAYKGAENYIVHDKMSAGLTFNTDSVAVKVGDTPLVADRDYTVNTTAHDSCKKDDTTTHLNGDCSFHVVFTKDYLDTITGETATTITITYTATLNGKAVMSTAANTNDTVLTYADDNVTEISDTDTYAFQFDLIKTDAANVLLDGAEFELYDAATAGNKIDVVAEGNGVYRVATVEEKTTTGFTSASIVVTDGKAVVEGLDANTNYYLEETKAPEGYNKLKERVLVDMKEANLTATINQGTQEAPTPATWTAGGVHVVNNTGSELPSTGGIGTTLFYVSGGLLVLVAVVMLVTRKRVSDAR